MFGASPDKKELPHAKGRPARRNSLVCGAEIGDFDLSGAFLLNKNKRGLECMLKALCLSNGRRSAFWGYDLDRSSEIGTP